MLQKLKYMTGVSTVVGLMFLSGASAQAVDVDSFLSDTEATESNIGLYSQYVWRGQRQSSGAMSVQGDVGLSHDSGMSANVWFATLGAGDATEFDVTLDYSGELDFMNYSAGVILYRYHNNGAANATEIYAGTTHELGSAKFYYDIDSKNIWIDMSSGIELAEVNLEGILSFAAPDVGTSEFVNLAFTVSKEIELEDMVLSPSFTYNYHMGALDTAFTPDALVLSINLSY